MRVTINTVGTARIDWNARGKARIAQNVQNLLFTWAGEVAHRREKGLYPDLIDAPNPETRSFYRQDITRVITTYEPLAEIVDIAITVDDQGDILALVDLEI